MSTYQFTVESIPEMAGKLTQDQKRLFNQIWNMYVRDGTLFPLRAFTGIFGKLPVVDALRGLNGSLIYESEEQGGNFFKLTLYGAFLTDDGPVLALLLARLLELIKNLCEEDSSIKQLSREKIKDRLALSDQETQNLFRILTLGLPAGMPFHLSHQWPDGVDWTITIDDKEAYDLVCSDEARAYLDCLLSAGYRSDEPWSRRDRLLYLSQRQNFVLSVSGATYGDNPLARESSSIAGESASDLNPWPVIRNFVLQLSSYDVPAIIDCAGLTVDWSLTEKQNYSHKTRLAEYRPRIDAAYQSLSTEDARLRVAYIVTQELAKRGPGNELGEALANIGWEVRGDRLAPSGRDICELFFPEQSQHAAYVEIRAILQTVVNRIEIIDPYIDQSILTLLSTCVRPGLDVHILTSRFPADFALERKKWLAQHLGCSLDVRQTKEFHDRFIVIDDTSFWHLGCSIKDAGNKAFMLNRLEDQANREALLAQVARSWDCAEIVS